MNEMTTFTIISVVIFLALNALFIFYRKPADKLAPQSVYVSERLEACEAKGGKYSLIWSNYNNEYHEGCSIVSQDIEEF